MHIKEFDLLYPKTLQRPIQLFAQVLGAIVEIAAAVGLASDARLRSDSEKITSLLTTLFQIGTDTLLRKAQAIHV